MRQSVQYSASRSAASPAKPGNPVLALAAWLTPWRLGLGLAIALMLACYVVAINAYWVGDDFNYVRPKDWNTVLNFFNPVGRAVYRPLTHSIWAADYALFGDAPFGWHITRLAIHALNIVWAALLVRALTGRTRLALLAAALFGIHPAHTETVTWMGGQADINFAAAWLPALWLFVRWRQGGARWMWLLAGLLGFVSMLGKEAAITLPLMSVWIDIIFGRDWLRWPGRRDRGWWRDWWLYPRLLAGHSPFIAASGLYVAMRLYLYLTGQGRLMYGVEEQLGFFSHTVDVITGYIFLALGAWWVPQELITEPLPAKLAIILLTTVLLVVLVRWVGRVALFAIGWTGITLLLTLQAVANRWFYLPALGVSIAIACVFVRLQDDLLGKAEPWRRALVALPLLFLVWWSVLTVVHNELWRQSGEVARGIMGQVRALHPDPPRPSTFYVANPPPTYKTVLLFNSGFGTAIYLAYHDWTGIKSYNLAEEMATVQPALADPSKIGPNPIFLRYEEGRIVEYPTLQALVDADRLR